jgi:hypothetical protein
VKAVSYGSSEACRAVIMRATPAGSWPAVTRSADGREAVWTEGEFDRD